MFKLPPPPLNLAKALFTGFLAALLQLAAIHAFAQTAPAATAQGVATSQPPDFASMYAFENGYKNIVTLKTTDTKRIFRMEGERCFVEGTFALDDLLGGQTAVWVIPANTFARSAADEKFCAAGNQVPVLLQKETKKSWSGAPYRVGEFKWNRFAGTFEVK